MEEFSDAETRVILRECKTVICVNCGFNFSNMLNYESNVVNLSIYGEVDGIKDDLITFLTLCKFNNLKTLVLQGLNLHFDDLAHILTSEHIDLLKKRLRLLDITNNPISSTSFLFDSFNPHLKILKQLNRFYSSELEKNKYYCCYFRLRSISSNFDRGCFFYANNDFRDYEKAFHYFSLACKDDPRAYEFIGYMYDKGRFVRKDEKAAFLNYLNGANHVNNCAYNVAMSYENGHGVEKNLKEAYKYYEMAAMNRHEGAIKRMARSYQEGVPYVIPQDYNLAIEYYKKLESFNKEESHLQTGHIYEVCLHNYQLAKYFFEKHLNRLNFLYRYTLASKRLGDQGSFEKGMTMLRRMYEEHNASSNPNTVKKEEGENSQINLTDPMLDILYYIGTLESSCDLLRLLFENVSEKTTDILHKIGDFYRNDHSYNSGEEAERFYKEGLGRGDKNAIFGLATMYISGVKGKFINLEAANKFASIFMQTNDLPYIFGLGIQYFYEKQYTQAMECFSKTAETFQESKYYISFIEGYYLEKGRNGYEKNVYKAMEYYNQSCTPNFSIPFGFYKTGKLAWKHKYDDLAYTVLKALVAQCHTNQYSPVYIYILGCLHQGGYYVNSDQMKAIKLFETASDMGYQRAKKTYERVLEKLSTSFNL